MSSVVDLDHVSNADADVGGKARNLARLRECGLPCPRGFVVPARSFAGASWQADAIAAASALRSPLAVRSSASIEDSGAGAAPGLFESVLGTGVEGLVAAIRRVRSSAAGAAVQSYCQLRDVDVVDVTMAVIVQEQIAPAVARGVLYTRPPGAPEANRVVVDIARSAAGTWSGERDRSGNGGDVPLVGHTWPILLTSALAAERAIDAGDGADVEWVIDADERVWLVQARPIVHPPPSRRPDPALFDFSRHDQRVWSWDVTHNPDPLSPAQAGLVERVGDGVAGIEMRTVGGYLYTATAEPPPRAADVGDSPGALTRFFTDDIVPVVDRLLGPLEDDPRPGLRPALDAYERVIEIYGQTVAPTLRAGREALRRFLDEHAPGDADRSALMAALLATRSDRHLAARIRRIASDDDSIASLLAYAAPMAPAWDVAAPTFAENPGPILEAVELQRQRVHGQRPDDTREADAHAIRLRAALSAAVQKELDRTLARAREAHELGETDDHIFFRAQAVVRRALLAVAERWRLRTPSDVFFVDLDTVLARGPRPPADVEERVHAARKLRDDQSSIHMPVEIHRGAPLRGPSPRGFGAGWRGVGCGGRGRGRILKVRDLGTVDEPVDGRVILARSLSPSQLFAVTGAAALVSVYGGPLGHAAAMARELGLPCVVQCPGAWEALADGDDVWVEGELGLVVRARP